MNKNVNTQRYAILQSIINFNNKSYRCYYKIIHFQFRIKFSYSGFFLYICSPKTKERCSSGLRGTLGKRVYSKRVPGVRIPFSPQIKNAWTICHAFFYFKVIICLVISDLKKPNRHFLSSSDLLQPVKRYRFQSAWLQRIGDRNFRFAFPETVQE